MMLSIRYPAFNNTSDKPAREGWLDLIYIFEIKSFISSKQLSAVFIIPFFMDIPILESDSLLQLR